MQRPTLVVLAALLAFVCGAWVLAAPGAQPPPAPQAQKTATADVLLGQALHQEQNEGRLEDAIATYRKVLAAPGRHARAEGAGAVPHRRVLREARRRAGRRGPQSLRGRRGRLRRSERVRAAGQGAAWRVGCEPETRDRVGHSTPALVPGARHVADAWQRRRRCCVAGRPVSRLHGWRGVRPLHLRHGHPRQPQADGREGLLAAQPAVRHEHVLDGVVARRYAHRVRLDRRGQRGGAHHQCRWHRPTDATPERASRGTVDHRRLVAGRPDDSLFRQPEDARRPIRRP